MIKRTRYTKLKKCSPVLTDHYGSLLRVKRPRLTGLYTHNCNSSKTVSVREMMWSGVRVSCCLIAESHQQVLRNVRAVVLKRCNSAAAVTQARPEEWDYAKPFEDIPGPKPLLIVGNTWRIIPFLGNVIYCFF